MPQISLRNGNLWKIFWAITCTEIDRKGGVVARPLVRQPPYRQNMGETPKQFQSWSYWPNMGIGGEPDTSEKSTGKTILKMMLGKFAGKHKYLVYICMDQVLFEKLQLYYVYCTTAVSLDNTNCWKCPSPVVSEESKTYKNVWQNIQHQKAALEASAFYHLFFFI